MWDTYIKDNINGGIVSVPAVLAYNNADQSLANDTDVALALNAEYYDTDGIHSTSVNTSRLTCQTAGKYLIWASVSFATNATGRRQVMVRKGGSVPLGITSLMAVTEVSRSTNLCVHAVADLAVGEYVELVARQTSGGSLAVTYAASNTPMFGMVRMG
jgi:hypothetical protein